MLNTTNKAGEFITVDAAPQPDKSWLVEKKVEGVLRSTYPKPNYGMAKAFMYNLIKQ